MTILGWPFSLHKEHPCEQGEPWLCHTMAFTGTWQIHTQENLEPFLKALGKWLLPPQIIASTAFIAAFPWNFSFSFYDKLALLG